jgi:hypothetical protein
MFSEAKCYKLLFDTLVLIINSFGFSNSTKEKIFLLQIRIQHRELTFMCITYKFSQNGQDFIYLDFSNLQHNYFYIGFLVHLSRLITKIFKFSFKDRGR